jgi:putative cohesin domain protein
MYFNKKIRVAVKTLVTICLVYILAIFSTNDAYALSARISFSDPSVAVDSEVTISMKINSLDSAKIGSTNITLAYDPAYLEFIGGEDAEGGAGTVQIKGNSGGSDTEWLYQLKFKALSAGSTSLSVKTWEVYDGDGNMASIDADKLGSSSITINAADGSANNAALSSLEISPGTLEPAFSSDVTEYKTRVGGSVDRIAVNAISNDKDAKIVISGNSELVVGENKIECKVTAADGTTEMVYNIAVEKLEGEITDDAANVDPETALSVSIGGSNYSIATIFDPSVLPEGFEQVKYTYNGQEISAAKSTVGDVLLLYLIAPDGSGSFYIYDELKKEFSLYVKINMSSKSITVLPLPDGVSVPAGFVENTITINNSKTVKGWVQSGEGEKEYCLVYAMNSEGEKNFYRYDVKEKTIQRYFENPSDAQNAAASQQGSNEEISKLKQTDQIKTYVIVALIIIIIAMLIYIISKVLRAGRNTYVNKKDELGDIDKKMSNSSLDLEEMDPGLSVKDAPYDLDLDNSDIEFEDIELLDLDDEEPKEEEGLKAIKEESDKEDKEEGKNKEEVKDKDKEEDKDKDNDKKEEGGIETIDL